jgi:dipeptidase E
MKFYLSSFKIGNQSEKLKEMVKDKKIGYIFNALDHLPKELYWEKLMKTKEDLMNLGLEPEMLDLKDYFGKENELEKKVFSFFNY